MTDSRTAKASPGAGPQAAGQPGAGPQAARQPGSGPEATPGAAPAGPGQLMEFYRRMVLIRKFELTADQMYKRAKIGGYCHLNLGEEASVVGLMDALRPTDYLFTNYRDHGYALMRGMDTGKVMAELFGKTNGVSKGRGGSMHMFDTRARMLGGYGIVGGQIPPATGAALALTYRGAPGPNAEAVMCQMGDGTTNIGAFHESLNLAAVWSLPIVYVVINNRLGMGTTVEKAAGEPELYKRGASYRIPGVRADGGDVLAVREAATEALDQARTERRPALLELMSYRLRGHSVVDPARYRSAADLETAQEADPVPALRARLIADGTLDEEQAAALETEVGEHIAAAVAFADAGQDPIPDQLFDYAYATPVANAPTALPGERMVVLP